MREAKPLTMSKLDTCLEDIVIYRNDMFTSQSVAKTEAPRKVRFVEPNPREAPTETRSTTPSTLPPIPKYRNLLHFDNAMGDPARCLVYLRAKRAERANNLQVQEKQLNRLKRSVERLVQSLTKNEEENYEGHATRRELEQALGYGKTPHGIARRRQQEKDHDPRLEKHSHLIARLRELVQVIPDLKSALKRKEQALVEQKERVRLLKCEIVMMDTEIGFHEDLLKDPEKLRSLTPEQKSSGLWICRWFLLGGHQASWDPSEARF